MVAVDQSTAAVLLSQPAASEVGTIQQYLSSLRRSLVAEGISDDLYDALDKALGEDPDAAPGAPRRVWAVLRRRSGRAPSLTVDEATRICDRFRRATTQLVQVVPYRVSWTPTEKLHLLRVLRGQQPDLGNPVEYLPYLRRYALAILDVLDAMGDDT
ncbi:hypothetical protein [Streptomyces rubradiris]|uniref:Uncharacterized protein n=1 Tax=Streptomyces rubradiris TaxID=285531 RepID=A0ABQ3RDE0_STRRR|nr:hypothetical protein [Streptomyces rubradiris]GHG95364.1 hypothetical protein GCM10018792_06100 [Streptomyces rubradiris]GHI53873.1 hypothetical protein Srubr_37190 [Streptomyces rubradiris]